MTTGFSGVFSSTGGSVFLIFSSRVLVLLILESGVLVTALMMLMGLLSSTDLMVLSAPGLTPFTGDVMMLRFFLVLGVLMMETLAGDTLDLLGVNTDLSLMD